jgi:hypothetical protein
LERAAPQNAFGVLLESVKREEQPQQSPQPTAVGLFGSLGRFSEATGTNDVAHAVAPSSTKQRSSDAMGKEIEISAILAQRMITLLLACPLFGNLTSNDWLLISCPSESQQRRVGC